MSISRNRFAALLLALVLTPQPCLWADGVWIVRGPKPKHVWRGHKDAVTCVAYSPDGKWIASGSCDATIRIWDAATGKVKLVLKGHTKDLLSVAFDRKGTLLVSASADGSVRVWNVQTGVCRAVLDHGRKGLALSAVISPDAKAVATAALDGTVKLWDLVGDKATVVYYDGPNAVTCVAYSRDGKTLYSSGADKTVRIRDAQSGKVRATFRHASPVSGLAINPDETLVAAGCRDGSVHLWDAATGKRVRTLKGLGEDVRSLAFSPNGKWLAGAGFGDKTARAWEVTTGKIVLIAEHGPYSCWNCVAFSPNGQWLAGAGGFRSLSVWDLTKIANAKPKPK